MKHGTIFVPMLRRSLSVLLPLLTAAGCANLVGLNSLEEVECVSNCGQAGAASGAAGSAGSSGSTGGTAGTGGASGKGGGGAGGAGGTAGASGTAGTGGKAGASGTGGGGASGTGGASGAGTGGTAGKGGGGSGGTSGGGTGGSAGGGAGGIAGASGSSGKAGAGGGCVAKTCASAFAYCGKLDDGCGKQLDCGSCMAPLECGVSGPPNVCGCKPDQYTCVADQLRRCTPDGSSYYLVADCPAGQCNASTPTAGKCNSCALGQVQCQGQQLMSCVDDGMGNKVLSPKGAACGAGQVCDPKTQDCDKCVPNGFYCVGSSLRKCSADGQTSSFVATCDSDALCAISVFTGECRPPVCATGEKACNGKDAVICNAGHTGFDVTATCATAALCKAGKCDPPVCMPGEKKCIGNTAQACNADQTGYDTTPCKAPTPTCDAGACGVRGPKLIPIGSPVKSYIDETEVTNAHYNAFLATSPINTSAPPYCATNATFGTPVMGKDAQPVVKVDWCDAQAFCAWSGKRLCGAIGGGPVAFSDIADDTKDQWQLACTGPQKTTYPYGNAPVSSACNGPSTAGPVNAGQFVNCEGGYPGVFDLSGNVAEWEDGCTAQSGPDDICPARGGSYASPIADDLKCASQITRVRSDAKNDNVGFRCCADP